MQNFNDYNHTLCGGAYLSTVPLIKVGYHGKCWCNGNVINLEFHSRGSRFESYLRCCMSSLRFQMVFNSPLGQYLEASCFRGTATACFQSMQENTRVIAVSLGMRPRAFSTSRTIPGQQLSPQDSDRKLSVHAGKYQGNSHLLRTTIACIQSLQEHTRIVAVSVGLRLLSMSHFHFADNESFYNRHYKF